MILFVFHRRTIGDAYICATNLMEEQDSSVSVRNAAIRALAMAKDMVLEAVNTQLPKFSENEIDDVEDKSNSDGVPSSWTTSFETLEIRVGIHIGDVMCGVLGQRLPKFTTCGKGKIGRLILSTSFTVCITLKTDLPPLLLLEPHFPKRTFIIASCQHGRSNGTNKSIQSYTSNKRFSRFGRRCRNGMVREGSNSIEKYGRYGNVSIGSVGIENKPMSIDWRGIEEAERVGGITNHYKGYEQSVLRRTEEY